jgi:hypothetical protein
MPMSPMVFVLALRPFIARRNRTPSSAIAYWNAGDRRSASTNSDGLVRTLRATRNASSRSSALGDPSLIHLAMASFIAHRYQRWARRSL